MCLCVCVVFDRHVRDILYCNNSTTSTVHLNSTVRGVCTVYLLLLVIALHFYYFHRHEQEAGGGGQSDCFFNIYLGSHNII